AGLPRLRHAQHLRHVRLDPVRRNHLPPGLRSRPGGRINPRKPAHLLPPITVPLHAPELAPGRWVQGPPVSIAFARGAVVLVDFWESTCVNCLRTLPYLKAWHELYAGRGLIIVGVHTPEFEFTADPELVAAAVRAEGIP